MAERKWEDVIGIAKDGRRIYRGENWSHRCAFPDCDEIVPLDPDRFRVCAEHERLIGEALEVQKMLEDWEPSGEGS